MLFIITIAYKIYYNFNENGNLVFILTGSRGFLVLYCFFPHCVLELVLYRDLNSFLERLNLNRDNVLLVYLWKTHMQRTIDELVFSGGYSQSK